MIRSKKDFEIKNSYITEMIENDIKYFADGNNTFIYDLKMNIKQAQFRIKKQEHDYNLLS